MTIAAEHYSGQDGETVGAIAATEQFVVDAISAYEQTLVAEVGVNEPKPKRTSDLSVVELWDSAEEPTDEDLGDEEIRALVAAAAESNGDPYFIDTLDHLRHTYSRAKLLTAAQEVQLAKQIERGDLAAKEKLIISNLRLVMSVAKRYQLKNHLTFPDAIQQGTTGLIRASEKFDWRRGYKFSTYATWWIRQAVTRGNDELGPLIGIPVHVAERRRKIFRTVEDFIKEHGQEPSDEVIAEKTGLTLIHIKEAREAAEANTSLNKLVGDDDEREFGDFFEDKGAEIEFETVETSARNRALYDVVKTLPEQERMVIEMRFGLNGYASSTLEAIGSEIGVTRERIRQIEKVALKKLATIKELQQAVYEPKN